MVSKDKYAFVSIVCAEDVQISKLQEGINHLHLTKYNESSYLNRQGIKL